MPLSELERLAAGIDPFNEGSPSSWDHSIRPNYVDMGLNLNSVPYKSDTAIIVTAWYEQLPYMKATLTNYRLTDKFIIGAYDQPWYSWCGQGITQNCLPTLDIWLLPHMWVMKHITYDADKRNGWFWDVRYAQGVIRQFPHIKYVYHVNADCIWTKPEQVDKLTQLIVDADADMMCISSDATTKHTCAIVYKVDAFHAIFDHMMEKFKTPTIGSSSPERTLKKTMEKLGIKELVAPVQPMEPDGSSVDHYQRYNQDSTWKQIVGFRNLAAEHLTALVEAREPVEKELIDTRFKSHLCTSGPLLNYYETGDRRWLHKLWDMNEESWYNRVHYPLEYYGEKPITDINNDPWMMWLTPKGDWVRKEELDGTN